MKRTIIAGCCLAVALAWAMATRAQDSTVQWNALVDEYLYKVYFPLNPTIATLDGVHNYDSEIEDYSHAGLEAQIKKLRDFVARLEQFPTEGLRPIDAAAKSCWARSAASR